MNLFSVLQVGCEATEVTHGWLDNHSLGAEQVAILALYVFVRTSAKDNRAASYGATTGEPASHNVTTESPQGIHRRTQR